MRLDQQKQRVMTHGVSVGGRLCLCACLLVGVGVFVCECSQAQRNDTIGCAVSGRQGWLLLLTQKSSQHTCTHTHSNTHKHKACY